MTPSRIAPRSPFRLIVWSIGLTLALLTTTGGITAASTTDGTLDETDRALALIKTSNVSMASADPNRPPTANERSIRLIESTYAPGGMLAGWDDIEAASADSSWPLTANERSIQLIEGNLAPGGILAGIPAPPARVAYADSEHGGASEVVIVEIDRGQPH